MLSAEDTAWFDEHPHREFRCRHLTAAEDAADDKPVPPDRDLSRLAYVRRGDRAMVKVTTQSPDLLLNEQDEGRARFFAQWITGSFVPDGEAVNHVELIEVSPEIAAYLTAYMAEYGIAERR